MFTLISPVLKDPHKHTGYFIIHSVLGQNPPAYSSKPASAYYNYMEDVGNRFTGGILPKYSIQPRFH